MKNFGIIKHSVKINVTIVKSANMTCCRAPTSIITRTSQTLSNPRVLPLIVLETEPLHEMVSTIDALIVDPTLKQALT